jgi:outer membrane protein OmpA-like peptidoglycan-associated protein
MGKKAINKFYKGFLECQYEVLPQESNSTNSGKSIDVIGQIELCPRYYFQVLGEIDELTYREFLQNKENRLIIKDNVEGVDFIVAQANNDNFTLRKTLFELAVNFVDSTDADSDLKSKLNINTDANIFPIDKLDSNDPRLRSYPRPLPSNEFSVNYSEKKKGKKITGFGRINGDAVCIVQDFIEQADIPTVPIPGPDGPNPKLDKCKFVDSNNLSCNNTVVSGTDFCGEHSGPTPPSPNCFDGCFQTNGTMGGCFNYLKRLVGCFGYSMPSGCGLLGLIPLLLLLALLWCFLFGDCGKSCNGSNRIIHDTVYVEVFREFKDTVKTKQVDTLKVMDSTITRNYNMITLPDVKFFTDKSIIIPGSEKDLDSLAAYLIKHPDLHATIEGHTDNQGDSLHNEILSKNRAIAVKNYLVKKGANANMIDAAGFGWRRPKTKNSTLEGRMLNRRVEVKLTSTKSTEKHQRKNYKEGTVTSEN